MASLQNELEQTKGQLLNAKKELSNLKDQQDKIDDLTEKNKRLKRSLESEEGITEDLQRQLKAKAVKNGTDSAEIDMSVEFEEKGNRIK